MKLWKALVILFCVLLGSGVSHAGFLSNDPGLSPGQTLPPGLIIPGPIISNPQLSGLITTVPGSTLWIQGNVQYEPYATIVGPDGSIWNINGLSGLASLTMSGVLTFADGSYWDSGGLDTTTSTVLNGPDGGIWDNRGIRNLKSLSVLGTITGPSGSWTSAGLNLTQPLSFNGIPMGGVCGSGNFVTALSSTGVITCAVGGGGAGVTVSATAPVSPAIGQLWFDTVGVQTYIWYNDGTSSQWVPVINAGGGASGSGTVTSVGLSGGTTGLTVSGSPVVTSGTMTLGGTLAIASGGTNATTAAAALTNLGAAPLASPSFTGTVNVAALTFNGIAMGGACTAGAFVQSISNSGVPTCGSNLGTSYAPLTNPAGGQNNYAPLASPVFTGTPSLPTGTIGVTQTAGTNNTTLATTAFVATAMSGMSGTYAPLTNPAGGQNNYAPLASPTFSGTITFPDGTTATTAGFNTMKALGIGVAAPTTAGQLLQITSNGNFLTQASISNSTSGTSAGSIIRFSNDTLNTGAAWIVLTSTAYTGSGPNLPGDTLQIGANGVGGINLSTNATITPGPPITIWSGPNQAGQFTQNGLVLPFSTSTTASSLMFGPTSSASLSAFTIGGNNAVWSVGGYSNNNAWTATNTAAIMQNMTEAAFSGAGGIAWYLNTGLTVGNTYTPNVVMQLGGNTLAVGFGANTGGTTAVNVANTGTGNAVAAFTLSNGVQTGTLGYSGNSYALGGGILGNTLFLSNPFSNATGNGGIALISTSANAPISFYIASSMFGEFLNNQPSLLGLQLPGYGGIVGNAIPGLKIGNEYFGGYNFANMDISGASYFSSGTWYADGGAGSGATLLALGPGTCITMYNTGSVAGGAAITWTSIGSWCGSGMSTDHLSNLTSFRLPTVSSGALTQDSRDMFGWVTNVTGGQTTLTFAEPFLSESNCSLTASGAPYLWFNANQSATQDTFVCAVPWTGEPCPDGATVEYHCFGQAGEPVKAP